MENNQNEGLKRELGIFDVAVNVVNISIASGIFLLPAIIAGILGNASIVAYALCGCLFLLVALCYAEAGSQITTSGGAYTFIEKAFGPYFGYLANAFLWFGTGLMVAAALANGIAEMLSVPFPVFSMLPYRGLLFLLLFAFLAFVNITGVKQGMAVIKTITLVKVIPLVLVVGIGLFHLQSDQLIWEGFPAVGNLGEAALILFFAFTGGEMVINIGGEMKNPKRTAPLGLMLGVVGIVVFYCLIQLVAQSVLGAGLIGQKAPLAAVAGALLGPWGSSMLIICAVIAIFGSLNSLVLIFSRVVFAGAKDGLLPAFLAKVHPRFATPHWAVGVFSLLAFIVAVSGGFRQLIVLATLSILFIHAGVALAVIRFRLFPVEKSPGNFTLPGGIAIPVVALVALIWFIFQSKSSEVMGIAVFSVVLTVLYALKVLAKRF